MKQAEFETLLYGWSEWGIQGTAGFQVIAASDGFRASIEDDRAIWRSAHRLCYFPEATPASAGISTGWVPAKNGIFVFRRQPAGADLFGRAGAFEVQVLYSPIRPSVQLILSILLGDAWTDASQLVPGNTHLPSIRLDTAEHPSLPPDRPGITDSLLSAVLASLSDRRRIRVHAPWNEMLEALACVADQIPVSALLSLPVSTLEGPSTIDDYWIAGCAGDGCDNTTTNTVISASAQATTSDRALARTFFASPAHVRAALDASGGVTSFDAPSFVSLLKILGDASAPLQQGDIQAIASSSEVLRVVLPNASLRSRVVGSILNDWSDHGEAFARTMCKLDLSEQTAATVELAAHVLLTATRGERVPEVASVLRMECPPAVPQFSSRLLAGCNENPDLIRSMPPLTAVTILSQVPHDLEVPQAFIRAAVALPIEHRSRLASTIDTPTPIRAAVLFAATKSGDCQLVRDSLHPADTDCWTHTFSTLHGHDLESSLASMVSCSGLDVAAHQTAIAALKHLLSIRSDSDDRKIFLQTLLAQSTGQAPLAATCSIVELPGLRPEERDLAAGRVTEVLTNLVMVRSNAAEHPLIAAEERRAIRRVRNSHLLLDDWDFAVRASGAYGLDDWEKTSRASEIRHRLDRSASDRVRLAMFLCWFERILVAVDSEEDFLLFMTPAEGLDPVLVWSHALAACAGRINYLVSQSRNSPKATSLADIAISATRTAERGGAFGRKLGRPRKAPKEVREWSAAMKTKTSPEMSRRSRRR